MESRPSGCRRRFAVAVVGVFLSTPVAARGNGGLELGGTNAYVSFGPAPSLGLSQFTLEAWFRRDGDGRTTRTGTGGLKDAVPILCKGRSESGDDTHDVNWFLGIDDVNDVLCADFEEGSAAPDPGRNHGVFGTTHIVNGVWYHAAATYDGSRWKLYLNGDLEAELVVNREPQSASVQHAAIGAALDSNGRPDGFFAGVIDEARVWGLARSATEILAARDVPLVGTESGLVARWGLDEMAGTSVNPTPAGAVPGTLIGSNWSWADGAPLGQGGNSPPLVLAADSPADGAPETSTSPLLAVEIGDADADALEVTFYGRRLPQVPPAAPDFSLIALPDTQYYSASMNGGTPAIFHEQTQWIVDNKDALNIAFVAHLGDCVQNGNDNNTEWQVADAAMARLEDGGTTGLLHGIPFGVAPGNHDQSPFGSPSGSSTQKFNQYFGVSRFEGRGYYGGHYSSNNDNNYALFSASGLDFVVLFFEYDSSPSSSLLGWADDLLTQYADRRAIVVSHYLMQPGTQGSWGSQGRTIYDALKHHPNLFLMLCGHLATEGRRTDTYDGNTVWTVLSDYQERSHGGDGWLRIYTFSPAQNEVRVQTYSPYLDRYEADSSSEFSFAYDMGGSSASAPDFAVIGTASGTTQASLVWSGLAKDSEYEWYATVSDGEATTTGPVWHFTTTSRHTIVASAGSGGSIQPGGDVFADNHADVDFAITPQAGYRIVDVQVDGSSRGAIESFTFRNLTADHSIAASFEVDIPSDAFTQLAGYDLRPVWPNPSLGETHVTYAVPVETSVRVQVYDVRGRVVAVLDEGVRPPGRHFLDWHAGRDIPGGVYFVQLQAGAQRLTRRSLILR